MLTGCLDMAKDADWDVELQHNNNKLGQVGIYVGQSIRWGREAGMLVLQLDRYVDRSVSWGRLRR